MLITRLEAVFLALVVLCCSCSLCNSQNDLCDDIDIAKRIKGDDLFQRDVKSDDLRKRDAESDNLFRRDAERDVFRRVKREFVPYKSGKTVAGQVSNALDHLLFFSGYDKRIRPQVKKILMSLSVLNYL